MRLSATVLVVIAATSLTFAPAIVHSAPAAGPQKSGKPATTGRPTASGKPATGGKPTTSGKPTTGQASMTTHATSKPTTAGKPAKAPSTKPATAVKPAKTPSDKPTATSTTSTASGSKSAAKHTTDSSAPTPTSGSTTTLNPIAAKIASKPNLNAKLTALLPIDPLTGKTMTLDKASLGFKNQGQFIAALHVSENLGIPFAELKSHMVTVTPGAPGEPPTATQTGSLGQAIQTSKSTANVTTEVHKAELQASDDLRITATTTSTVKTTPKGGVR